MRHEESSYPSDWLRIAEKDLNRVSRLLSQDDPELAGFCLQQSIEKFLKGFLLSRGWKLRRIHGLDALLDDAVVFDPSFEQFRDVCIKITSFYFAERYPALDVIISKHDVSDSLQQATKLIQKIRLHIKTEPSFQG